MSKPRSHTLPVSSKSDSDISLIARILKAFLFILPVAGFIILQCVMNAAEHKDQSSNPLALSRLGDNVTARLINNGNRRINFAEGRDLLTSYVNEGSSAQLQLQSSATPLALASDDFDEDGVPDLVCSYGENSGGLIAVHRGNLDSIYPNSAAAKRRRQEGAFTAAPFLASALVVEMPARGDLIGAGDFDADGHLDLVAAQRGGSSIYFLRGDGKGNLRLEKTIEMPGSVTAMTTGEINRADSLTDIVIGLTNASGSKALVFESPEGAIKAEAEPFDLPAQASSFALGELDGEYPIDLAIAAGRQLLIVRGRERQLATARVERRSLNFSLKSIVVGDFIGDARTELALLGNDGVVRALGDANNKANNKKGWSLARLKTVSMSVDHFMQATELISSRVSSLPGDTILVLDSQKPNIRIIEAKKEAKKKKQNKSSPSGDVAVELQLESAAKAILPMQLNSDAINDLIVLESGKTAPVIIPSAVNQVFTVDNNGDLGDVSPGDGVCIDSGGNCTLRAAIQEANANAGPDAISFNTGAVTFVPFTSLPLISESLTIDGTTDPAFLTTPIIEVNGINFVDGAGVGIAASNCTVQGLIINRCPIGVRLLSGSNNIVRGNFIGTDVTGTASLGNASGVLIESGATNNTIGGTVAAGRNLISGNVIGVEITGSGTSNNSVQGNFIGTDLTGAAALNNLRGMLISTEASNNLIGGANTAARNVISSNTTEGIRLTDLGTTANRIQGNFIGTDLNGTGDLGNLATGIIILGDASGNIVGGQAAGTGNRIAFNNTGGVQVVTGIGNAILSNSIFLNDNIGINLDDDSVTPNDPNDTDTGPNNVQNFPDITAAETSGSAVLIQGTLNTRPGAGFRIQFFASSACDPSGNGEGERFLGSTVVDNLGIGTAAFSVILPANVAVGEIITATATDSAGNTSEFSACVAAITLACAIDCPDNLTIFIDPTSSQCGVAVNFAPVVAGTCGAATCIPPAGTLFNIGTTQINCQTEVGPACSFEITVIDNVAPALVCPEAVTGELPREGQTAIINYPAPTVDDSCMASLVSCTPPSGSAFPLGQTFVTCLARDDSGNEASCLFSVVVRERGALTITCPTPVTVEIPSGQTSTAVSYPPPVLSDSSGTTVTCVPPSGATFPLGVTAVNCTAVDTSQRQASCSFTVSVNGGAPSVRVVIESGDPEIRFGEDTPVNPTRRPPRQEGPCGLFTIENTSRVQLTLTFAEAVRTGADVNNGRITNPNEGGLYTLSIVNSNGSEEEVSVGGTVVIGAGQSIRFCLRFTPLFPRVLSNNQNVPATAVMPDVVTSRVRFNLGGGSPVLIDVNGRIDRRLLLINPDDPRQAPVVKFARNGDEIIVTYSVFDPNLNVSDATYEMLDNAGQAVETLTVSLASAIADADLIKGQSFTVAQRFAGAQTRQEIVRCRLTVRDGETSVTRVSEVASASQSSAVRLRTSGRIISPHKPRLTRPAR